MDENQRKQAHESAEFEKELMEKMTEEREEKAGNAAMCKAAAEEAYRKRLRMAPYSTQKRSFNDILVAHFAKKRRRTEAEEGTHGGYSSPVAKKIMRHPSMYKTPEKLDLDWFLLYLCHT